MPKAGVRYNIDSKIFYLNKYCPHQSSSTSQTVFSISFDIYFVKKSNGDIFDTIITHCYISSPLFLFSLKTHFEHKSLDLACSLFLYCIATACKAGIFLTQQYKIIVLSNKEIILRYIKKIIS